MKIDDFLSNYQNHPVLFVGTGFSLRYLNNSFTWNHLLERIALDLYDNEERYLDIKYNNKIDGGYDYPKIAEILEKDFNNFISKPENRNGEFKELNDEFYARMKFEIPTNRFKLYLAKLLFTLEIKEDMKSEINELKKVRKNIACVITTNYDTFIESIFEFNPLIGNDILLSNPYGSVYKIHGSVSDSENIIISNNDYEKFERKYELIRAQLLSLFIHNPIIFFGYSVSDENIKSILKMIFSYVTPNSEEAEKIRSNFLLVEYEKDSENEEITDHDIQIESLNQIRINKIKTDNFINIYQALSKLNLPVTAMDIRKVETVLKEIRSGSGGIQVQITESLEDLKNGDKVLAIGSQKTIQVEYQNKEELLANYFNILDESNSQRVELINKYTISNAEWFPFFAFKAINDKIDTNNVYKRQQEKRVKEFERDLKDKTKYHSLHTKIEDILEDENMSKTYKLGALSRGVFEKRINLEDLKEYLKNMEDKNSTDYRKLLCVYDFMEYNNN